MLEQIDQYKFIQKIGAGGQATVHLYEDTILNREVAIKVMHQFASSSQEYVSSIEREARIAASLDHPNIVKVYEFIIRDDNACIVMEYLPGSIGRELELNNRIEVDQAIDIFQQICRALEYSHQSGYLHRDVKPHNLLTSALGEVKLSDFGISRAIDHTKSTGSMGTLVYMPPEQYEDKGFDVRSEIYSLGITFYEILAGSPPFSGSWNQLRRQHLESTPTVFEENLNVPNEISEIIFKCLEKDPDDRYQEISEIRKELEAFTKLQENPIRAAGTNIPDSRVSEPFSDSSWRRFGPHTILGKIRNDDISGITRKVQAGAGEVAFVVRNGQLIDVFSEDRKSTRPIRDLLLSLLRKGPKTEVYKATSVRFNLIFWLGEDETLTTGNRNFSFGLPVSTKDNQLISAKLNLWIQLTDQFEENILRLLGGQDTLNKFDIADQIRDALHGKVLSLELSNYTYEELRGNRDLIAKLGESIQREISGTLQEFGLRLQDFSLGWGLTLDEQNEINRQKHEVSVQSQKNINEIESLRKTNRASEQVPLPKPTTRSKILTWSWITVIPVSLILLVFAFIIFYSPASTESTTPALVLVPETPTLTPIPTPLPELPPIAPNIPETSPTVTPTSPAVVAFTATPSSTKIPQTVFISTSTPTVIPTQTATPTITPTSNEVENRLEELRAALTLTPTPTRTALPDSSSAAAIPIPTPVKVPFTLNSSRKEVLEAQGYCPTSAPSDIYPDEANKYIEGKCWMADSGNYFGTSSVGFMKQIDWSSNTVSSWDNTGNLNLVERAPSGGFLIQGITNTETLLIQGNPDRMEGRYGQTWFYGGSEIAFTYDPDEDQMLLLHWVNTDNNLRISTEPTPPTPIPTPTPNLSSMPTPSNTQSGDQANEVPTPTPTSTSIPPTVEPFQVSGQLWAWGLNKPNPLDGGRFTIVDYGQLGDGTTTNSNSPVREASSSDNWVEIAAREEHSHGIKSDGTLWSWGEPAVLGIEGWGVPNHPRVGGRTIPAQESTEASDWTKVFAGTRHVFGLKSDGTLWGWGYNNNGQLGTGGDYCCQGTENKDIPTQETSNSTWVKAALGSGHTVAIKSNGTLWAWGANHYGQLGNSTFDPGTSGGNDQNSTIPVLVSDEHWIDVSAGENFTAAIKSDGTLWSWGKNTNGQIGTGVMSDGIGSPTQESSLSNNWKSVSAGLTVTFALKSDGTLWHWGSSLTGASDISGDNISTPTQESSQSSDWHTISAGNYHVIALKNDRTFWGLGGMGLNTHGALSDSTGANDWSKIAAGSYHTIALK